MPLPNVGMTFTPFDPLTAAEMNDLVENIEALADSTGLDLDFGALSSFDNPYKFSAYRGAAHTSNNSYQLIQFDTEVYDSNNNFDSVTNKGRYTAPVDGFYDFQATAGNTAATGIMGLAIYKNGSPQEYGTGLNQPSAGNLMQIVTLGVELVAGDYVEIWFQGGAGSTMFAASTTCNFKGRLASYT